MIRNDGQRCGLFIIFFSKIRPQSMLRPLGETKKNAFGASQLGTPAVRQQAMETSTEGSHQARRQDVQDVAQAFSLPIPQPLNAVGETSRRNGGNVPPSFPTVSYPAPIDALALEKSH